MIISEVKCLYRHSVHSDKYLYVLFLVCIACIGIYRPLHLSRVEILHDISLIMDFSEESMDIQIFIFVQIFACIHGYLSTKFTKVVFPDVSPYYVHNTCHTAANDLVNIYHYIPIYIPIHILCLIQSEKQWARGAAQNFFLPCVWYVSWY